jgi:hypothetical protein
MKTLAEPGHGRLLICAIETGLRRDIAANAAPEAGWRPMALHHRPGRLAIQLLRTLDCCSRQTRTGASQSTRRNSVTF